MKLEENAVLHPSSLKMEWKKWHVSLSEKGERTVMFTSAHNLVLIQPTAIKIELKRVENINVKRNCSMTIPKMGFPLRKEGN